MSITLEEVEGLVAPIILDAVLHAAEEYDSLAGQKMSPEQVKDFMVVQSARKAALARFELLLL